MIIQSLILATVLSCSPTNTYNLTQVPFDDTDHKMYEHASKRCGEISAGQDPCLSTFIKYYTIEGDITYRAYCSEEIGGYDGYHNE